MKHSTEQAIDRKKNSVTGMTHEEAIRECNPILYRIYAEVINAFTRPIPPRDMSGEGNDIDKGVINDDLLKSLSGCEAIMEDKIEMSKTPLYNLKAVGDFYKQILEEQSKGYKYLLVYRNQKELLEWLNNDLCTISNPDGTYLCDLDRNFCDDGSDCMSDWVSVDDTYKQDVMPLRVAIALIEEEWI